MSTIVSAALQFPTIVFTFLLALLALYWLLVLVGIAPLELFERDSLRDDHMASTFVSLGFAGVPVSMALSLILLIAGALSLAIELLLLSRWELGMFRVPLGLLTLWATIAIASPIASALCYSLHRPLHRHRSFTRRCLLGATVIVATREGEFATAEIEGEPGVQVKLHDKGVASVREGQRRVLVKYLAEEGAYRSVAEGRYLDTRARLSKLRLEQRHRQAADVVDHAPPISSQADAQRPS